MTKIKPYRVTEKVQAALPRRLNQFLACKIGAVMRGISRRPVPLNGIVPVLCYHQVLPNLPKAEDSTFAVTSEQFESQLVFLLENGFSSLSLEEFKDMAQGTTTTRPSVLITFDDGYYDNFAIAWPIAQKYGVKINIFVLTKVTGSGDAATMEANPTSLQVKVNPFQDFSRMMNWNELRCMQKAGVSIGLHGHTHRRMSSFRKETIAEELDLAIHIFRKELGTRPWAFAIPYGSPGTFTTEILELLESRGLEVIFSTLNGRACLPGDDLPIRRIVVSRYDDLKTFEMKVFGGLDWLGRIRALEQRVRNIYNLALVR